MVVPANLAFGSNGLNPLLLHRHGFRAQTFDLCIWNSGKSYMSQVRTVQLSVFVVFKFDEAANCLVGRQHNNTGVFDRNFRIARRIGRANKLSHPIPPYDDSGRERFSSLFSFSAFSIEEASVFRQSPAPSKM